MTSACPPPAAPTGFNSQADIDRAGVAFSKAPPDDPIAAEPVQRYREFRMHCLATTLDIVAAARMSPRALVSVRLKRLDSIHRKVTRGSFGAGLGRMYDVVGVRVVCESLRDVRGLSGRIRSLPECSGVNDYTERESPSGARYRAIHHIMRFQQPLTADKCIAVRFEIQVRSFYQHQWAVWTESKGERAKAGRVDGELDENLRKQLEGFRELSGRIARWEEQHPGDVQKELPQFSGGRDIAVAWRRRNAPPSCELFGDDVNAAVDHLNFLEGQFPASRNDALLLVGVTDPGNAEKILRLTHPLAIEGAAAEPEHWMPPGS